MDLEVIFIRSGLEFCCRVVAEDQDIEFAIALIVADADQVSATAHVNWSRLILVLCLVWEVVTRNSEERTKTKT